MDLSGSFAGIVEDNKDPEKMGRLKVRVPHVFGAVGGVFGAITTDSLPWALPTGLPNGMTQQSGGADWIPEVGDQVIVRFLDGEPEKPIYEWFMQTLDSVDQFKLHAYETGPSGSVGKPKRGAWVRYGHTVEWNTDGLILTTSKGYRMLLTDASPTGRDGDISLTTQAGQFLEMDDSVNGVTLNVNEDFNINVGNQMLAMCDSISLQTMGNEIEMISGSYLSMTTAKNLEGTVGQDWLMDVVGKIVLTSTGSMNATSAQSMALNSGLNLSLSSAAQLTITSGTGLGLTSAGGMVLNFPTLSLGVGAFEPYVLGIQLMAYLTALYTVLVNHTHGGVMGGPSTTSTMLPQPPAPVPTMLSTTILGR